MAKQTPVKPKKSPAPLFERFQGADSGTQYREWLSEMRAKKGAAFKEGKFTHFPGETVVEYTDNDFPPDTEEPAPV